MEAENAENVIIKKTRKEYMRDYMRIYITIDGQRELKQQRDNARYERKKAERNKK
jgi:hypothetical protein